MNIETLESERLSLRKLTPEVLKHAFSNFSAAELMTFLGLKSVPELDRERAKYEKGISTHNKSFLYFQIIGKASGEIIGWCGFHTWYLDHNRAEIGYGITDDVFRQQGIMTEAIRPIIEYGFKKLGLNRIEAFIGPDNKASLRLIENLNFKKEGLLRQHYCKNNQMEDSLLYALLREEYVLVL